MDFDVVAKQITDKLEKFKNKEKLNWKEVFDNELNNVEGLKDKDREVER